MGHEISSDEDEPEVEKEKVTREKKLQSIFSQVELQTELSWLMK